MNVARTWLMLIGSVTGQNKTARMRIWRALKASGAAALRDGVYVLPNSPAAHKVFHEQAREIVAAGGRAQRIAFDADGDAQQREFTRLFERSAEYAGLLSEVDAMNKAIAKADEATARRRLNALRRDVDALAAIDFFPGSSREQLASALAGAEAAINAQFSPDEPHAAKRRIPLRERARYRGHTWATRARPWVDRIACTWLIRRFIDPQAKFLWLKRAQDCPKKALGFDFDGAEFSHVGTRVTFEVLAASFGLDRDRAIARLGALVHYLDVGGIPVPEAAGFAAILAGARAKQPDDDKLVRHMSAVLDALYASYAMAREANA
jgi:hypothetical protein